MLDDFERVIFNRESAMLDFMREPKSIANCASHRFVYRPSVDMNFVDHVETRSAQIHIARMMDQGRVVEVSEGIYRTADS